MNLTEKLSSPQIKKKRLPTAVTRDLGIRLNLKMVLYLENLCIMEKSRLFNPKPRLAPGRFCNIDVFIFIAFLGI